MIYREAALADTSLDRQFTQDDDGGTARQRPLERLLQNPSGCGIVDR